MIYLTSIFYFFYFSIIGVHIIFMPKVLELLGYSSVEIGLVFAAAPLVRFVVPLFFIRGLKLGNTSFFIALGILLFSVTTFFFTIHSFYLLLLSNIFFGVGLSLILPYIELISLQEIGKERYGKSRLFGSIGFMAVALVLVKFLSNPLVAVNYLAVLSYLTIIFAYIVVRHAHSLKNQTKEDVPNDVDLLADWKLWIAFMLMQVSFGPFYNFFTIYETAHGVSLDMTIYLWSFGVLIEIFMLFFQGKFLQNNLLKVIEVTVLATTLRWSILLFFPSNLMLVFFSQSLHALSFALFHSAAISYLYHRYANKALAQQLFSGISYGLGGLIGASVAGVIYEYYPEYLFGFSAAVTLLTFFFLHSFQNSYKNAVS